MNNYKTENVILLNMSTLNNTFSNWYYKIDNGEVILIEGKGQLEAGTKYIVSELLKQDEIVDRIVVTCSPEAMKYSKQAGMSAFEYYKKRIFEFLKGNGIEDDGTGNHVLKRIGDELNNHESTKTENIGSLKEIRKCSIVNDENFISSLHDRYRDIDDDFIFPVKMEDVGTRDAEKIRELSDRIIGKSEVANVYMDIQGGSRSFTYVLNALMALSDEKKLNVKSSVASNFYFKNIVNEIKDNIESFRLVELITAMKAFTNYGRGDLLVKYFESRGFEKSSRERLFVDSIANISDAVRISDPAALTSAITTLGFVVSRVNHFNDPFLEYVKNDIVEDYGEILFDYDQNDSFAVAKHNLCIIEWCIRKGFIQQGLTLIEDKMPEMFFDKKVIRQVVDIDNINSHRYDNALRDITNAYWYETATNIRFYKLMRPASEKALAQYRDDLISEMATELVSKVENDKIIEILRNDEDMLDAVTKKWIDEMGVNETAKIDFEWGDFAVAMQGMLDGDPNGKYCKGYKSLALKLQGRLLDKKFESKVQAEEQMKEYLSTKLKVPFEGLFNCSNYALAGKSLKEKKTGNQRDVIKLIRNSFSGEDNESVVVRKYLFEKEIIKLPEKEKIANLYRPDIEDALKNILLADAIPNEEGMRLLKIMFDDIYLPNNYRGIMDAVIEKWLEDNPRVLHGYRQLKDRYKVSEDNIQDLHDKLVESKGDYEAVENYVVFRELEGTLERRQAKLASSKVNLDADIFRFEILKYLAEKACAKRIGSILGIDEEALNTWAGLRPKEPIALEVEVKKNNRTISYTYSISGRISKKLEQNAREIDRILRLQEALKKERNNSNHASEKGMRLDIGIVERMMSIYVDMCRKYIVEPLGY